MGRKKRAKANIWCLVVFIICDLFFASWIAFFTVCPCCQPLDLLNPSCDDHQPCSKPPCVRKCCPEGQGLFRENNNTLCTWTNSSFSLANIPLWINESQVVFEDLTTDPSIKFHVINFGLCSYKMYKLDPTDELDKYALQEDGNLLLISSREIVGLKDYCIEFVLEDNSTGVFQCFYPPSPDELTDLERKAFPAGMSISLVFLLLTGMVYLMLPELQNLHGKCSSCHVASLSVAYVTLVLVQTEAVAPGGSSACVIAAFVVQFSFLATFFWLNVMCFDIWWVFSGLRPMQGSKKEREHKKFVLYSLYAWGGPLIIFIITICMELIPSIPDTFVKPQFGINKCWFKESKAVVLYFYLPIGVLVLLNIVMFITTAFRLRVHTRETKQVLKGKDSGKSDEADRQRFNLYLKLFIVMGMNWVMELVSFAVGGPKFLWFVTDIGNTLQGLLIFLIFVWKRRILRLLNQKICPKWNLVSATTTTKGSKVSSSRTSSTNLSKTVSSNPDNVSMQPFARKISISEDSDGNN